MTLQEQRLSELLAQAYDDEEAEDIQASFDQWVDDQIDERRLERDLWL